MNAVVPVAAPAPANPLAPQNFDQAVRLAEMMARGKLVPVHLQGSVSDCLMVIEQAMRWRMSPFAVAQCTSVIKGKLMFEGKLVAAAVETVGAITGHFHYTFTGAGADRGITVSATRTGETTPQTVDVKLKDAKTDNGMWVKQPDQQLVYHGARVWARRWTPAVILGVYSREEPDMDEPAADAFIGTTIDSTAAEGPAQGTHEAVNAAVPFPEDKPPEDKAAIVAAVLAQRFADAKDREEYDLIVMEEQVGRQRLWLESKRPKLSEAVEKAASAALARVGGDAAGDVL